MGTAGGSTSHSNWTDVFCVGIDFNLPGNGGQECADFLDPGRRVFETFLAAAISIYAVVTGYQRLAPPSCSQDSIIREDRGGKRVLLVMLSLIMGVEIGFKLATRSLIFILNPCHVTTLIQLYLLAAPPSPMVTWVFRTHLNFLNGAILALLFPVTNTRFLPFEVEVYYIQHVAMLIVPYYLLRLGGVYTIEKPWDFYWPMFSYGILLLYHFTVLQFIGMRTLVNLNSMVCPAISDPFYGPNYRVAAIAHQALMVPLVSKVYGLVASYFLTCFSFTKVKDKLESDLTLSHVCPSSCVNNLQKRMTSMDKMGVKKD